MISANFDKPLTTAQAVDRFACETCKNGRDCGWSCVESSTCSLRCQGCGARNWFSGNLPDTTSIFACHTCGSLNRWSWRPMRLTLVTRED